MSGLNERVEIFKTTYARPFDSARKCQQKRLSDQDEVLQLVYDLIDDRDRVSFDVTRALLGRNGGKVR